MQNWNIKFLKIAPVPSTSFKSPDSMNMQMFVMSRAQDVGHKMSPALF